MDFKYFVYKISQYFLCSFICLRFSRTRVKPLFFSSELTPLVWLKVKQDHSVFFKEKHNCNLPENLCVNSVTKMSVSQGLTDIYWHCSRVCWAYNSCFLETHTLENYLKRLSDSKCFYLLLHYRKLNLIFIALKWYGLWSE